MKKNEEGITAFTGTVHSNPMSAHSNPMSAHSNPIVMQSYGLYGIMCVKWRKRKRTMLFYSCDWYIPTTCALRNY